MNATGDDRADLLDQLASVPPHRRLAHLEDSGQVEPLLMALADEAERQAASEVTRSIAASKLVVDLADEAKAPLARARARMAHAQTLAYAGRFTDALPVYREAIRIAEGAGQPIEAARARIASLHALASLARFDEAIAVGEAARTEFLEAGETVLAARADINLGATHQMRDQPRLALVHFDRARSALALDPVTLAQLETNRGNALVDLGDFGEAEAAFESAVLTFEAEGLSWAAAIAEGNLAYLATRQGHLEPALRHYERARRHLEHDDARVDLARLLSEQAEALAILGLLDEARITYEQVLPELEAHQLELEVAQARAGFGRVLVRLGRFAEAEAELGAATAAFDALNHATARARVDLVRAELARVLGHPEQSRTLAVGALEVVHDRPLEAAAARHHLANLALDGGDLPTAARELAMALAAAERLQLAPVLADLLHLRGQLHRAAGATDLAIADLRAAVAEVERMRGTLQAERFRAAFLGNRLAIYEDLVVQTLDDGGRHALAEAFRIVERAKSRTLLDTVGGAVEQREPTKANRHDPAEVTLLSEMARLRAELNWHYSQLTEDDSVGTVQKPAAWQSAIREREREINALQSRFAAARGVAELYALPIDLLAAQQMIPSDTALIEYFLAGDELMAFVIRCGNACVFRDLADDSALAGQIRRVRFQISRALVPGIADGRRGGRLLDDARRELGALHALLLAPLRSALAGVERLVIIPHGALHTVPFHALWDGEQYLIDRYEVNYAPSASVLSRMGRGDTSAPSSGRALVVGVPDTNAPRIADETGRVAGALGTSNVLLGSGATAACVSAAAEDADIIHLACHGRFSPESPLTSGIKLADRWLTGWDVYGLRLRAAHVTLSGCETGRSSVGSGDEVVGLVRAYLAAGASSLIVSLWVVNDDSTTELMTNFYSAWRAGMTRSTALREAQRAVRARRPHPSFWAPFILGARP